MPDLETLAVMYGPGNEQFRCVEASHSGTAGTEPVVRWLEYLRPGTFLDYGSGGGYLLREAAKRGWEAVGVEFDRNIAEKYSGQSGSRIITDLAMLEPGFKADLLHLGDVIEHLTDPDSQIPPVLDLLNEGGIFLAQGPLESNPSLFLTLMQWARRLRGRKRVNMAPYHVMLATAKGQQAFFRRFGLAELNFKVSEVAWPAPESVSISDLGRPRTLALYCARRLSRAVSRLRPGKWGNRYFYVGHWKRESAAG
ncbi:MAG: class I SAM-dependent methyltransferase [Blastocatellia bacterium]